MFVSQFQKKFGDSLPVWGNPNLIIYQCPWCISSRVDPNYTRSDKPMSEKPKLSATFTLCLSLKTGAGLKSSQRLLTLEKNETVLCVHDRFRNSTF